MKMLTVQVPDELHRRLKDEAHEANISMAEIVRRALEAYLKEADDD